MSNLPPTLDHSNNAYDNALGLSHGNSRIARVIRRWKSLFILGALVGAIAGFWYFSHLPQAYKAVATIQVVTPAKEVAFLDTINTQALQDHRSRSDELSVLSSEAVLVRAVEKGRLKEHPLLLGKSPDQILRFLQAPNRIEVKLGSQDPNSNIFRVGVTTNNASLSGDLVQAIVTGYEDFVLSCIKNYTNEAKKALMNFADKYEKAKDNASDILESISKNDDLIFQDGEIRDPLSDLAAKLRERIQILEDKRRALEANLSVVEIGIQSKIDSDLLLVMLAIDHEPLISNIDKSTPEEKLEAVVGALHESIKSISFERRLCENDLQKDSARRHQNYKAIQLYNESRKGLESIQKVTDQVKEDLRRLDIGQNFATKIIHRLDLPTMGRFDGPHWQPYTGIGALIGILLVLGLAFLLET